MRLLTQITDRSRAGGVGRLAVPRRHHVDQLVIAYLAQLAGPRRWSYGCRGGARSDPRRPTVVVERSPKPVPRSPPTPAGPPAYMLRPTVPVVAITGTNGKTTTSRMIGYFAQRAEEPTVGWSSTDGVYLNGELVEAGDFSGPAGARQVLRQPGLQLRSPRPLGGILRRGVGVATTTSRWSPTSADHLGLGGIDTLDQLAEVKAVITKITKPTGWCVLNADDPRTFAMRLGTGAGLGVRHDPDSPSGRTLEAVVG